VALLGGTESQNEDQGHGVYGYCRLMSKEKYNINYLGSTSEDV